MTKTVFCSLIMLLLAMAVHAQMSDADAAKVRIDAAASALQSLQCDIVQTKHVSLLSEEMVSRGKMFYSKADKLRWQYAEPYSYTFILNGLKAQISKGDRNDVVDVGQSKFFKEIARIMMNSVVGRCISDEKDFAVRMDDDGSHFVAHLTPKRKDMRRMFNTIVLRFDKRTCMVKQVELYESNGDYTIIEMKNVQTNTPIDASVFSVG